MWAFDDAQLKNFTTYGALVPIVVGLVIFKFAVSAMVRSVVLIVALALGATAAAYAWYLNGVKVLGAGSAAAYMSLVPLFGILFSSLWLGESLTVSLLSGAALAISGMLLMNLGRLRMARGSDRPPVN